MMIIRFALCCCAFGASGAFAAAPAQQGMTVVRDAQTGRLRAPTAAELRALRGAVRQPQMVEPAPLKSVVRPDGTRSIDLGERSMVYSVIQRGADGKLAGHCVKGPEAAAAAVGATRGADHETE